MPFNDDMMRVSCKENEYQSFISNYGQIGIITLKTIEGRNVATLIAHPGNGKTCLFMDPYMRFRLK